MSAAALEFIITAWCAAWLWITAFLIGIITTIVLTITAPYAINAFRIAAHKLIWMTFTAMTAAVLIRTVRTMWNAIADL